MNYVGYKYQTPLKSDYLNSIISSLSRPGMLRRIPPKVVELDGSTMQANLQIPPLEALIVPADAFSSTKMNGLKDAYNSYEPGKLTKVVIGSSEPITISVTSKTVAIGLQFTPVSGDGTKTQSQEATFVPISYDNLNSSTNLNSFTTPWADGSLSEHAKSTTVIIATCFKHGNKLVFTMNGAHLSPIMLSGEGWSGPTYPSILSPFVNVFNTADASSNFNNTLCLNAMRTGMPLVSGLGFLNGHNAFALMNSTNTKISLGMFSGTNELTSFGILKNRGNSNTKRYHLISLDTDTSTSVNNGLLRIAYSTNDSYINGTAMSSIPGSTIAVLEMMPITSTTGDITLDNFAGFKLHPVIQEHESTWWNEDTNTLVIK